VKPDVVKEIVRLAAEGREPGLSVQQVINAYEKKTGVWVHFKLMKQVLDQMVNNGEMRSELDPKWAPRRYYPAGGQS
jgi:hypothetical protein